MKPRTHGEYHVTTEAEPGVTQLNAKPHWEPQDARPASTPEPPEGAGPAGTLVWDF